MSHRSSQGFSLLEVLVAFVILALVLGVLMQIFSGGLRNVHTAANYQKAVLLAQSKLSTVGIELPMEAGEVEGEFQDGYRWRVAISEYLVDQSPDNRNAENFISALQVKLMQVEVSVSWGQNDQQRRVNLKTLRIASEAML